MITNKKIVFIIALFFLASCSTLVHIDTKPEGAKTRINGRTIDQTPSRTSLSDFIFNQYDIVIEKDGYFPLRINLEKELKFGPIIWGFFLGYWPWLWAYGPKPYYYFELDEIQPGVTQVKSVPVIIDKNMNISNSANTNQTIGIWKSASKLKVVVFDFDSSYSESDGKTIAELFSVELVDRRVFMVLDRSQMKKIIDEQKLQLSGVTEEEKSIKVGQLLGANKIITGSILKIGGNYFITVKGIDVNSGSVEISDRINNETVNGLINSIPALTDSFIIKALGSN